MRSSGFSFENSNSGYPSWRRFNRMLDVIAERSAGWAPVAVALAVLAGVSTLALQCWPV